MKSTTYSSVACLLLATLLGTAARAADGQNAYEERSYKDADGKTLPYRLLRPRNYDLAKKYPLVLFLHGAGERGSDNRAQIKHCVELFARPANLEKYPCFVMVPQCPANQKWVDVPWDTTSNVQPKNPSEPMRLALEALKSLQKEYSIDEHRLYVSGLSMGGFGTWDLITRYPEMFAAAVPICGGGDETKAAAAVKTPIWAFHSADDPVVKVIRTRNMIKAIRDAGGEPKYTEYNGLGHGSWGKAYSEPELLPWMFSQARR